MKEKRKGHSRRRLFWLLGAVVFLLGGYLSLPYAQTAFVNWWEDDPFTPLCDVPNLLLYMQTEWDNEPDNSKGFNFYNVETGELFIIAEDLSSDASISVSPNGQYILIRNSYGQYSIYELMSNTQIRQFDSADLAYWLSDNRLLYEENGSITWLIYNPEDQSQEPFSPAGNRFFMWSTNLNGNGYFLAEEWMTQDGDVFEMVMYQRDLQRRVLRRFSLNDSVSQGQDSLQSPDRHYMALAMYLDSPEDRGLWLFDLSHSNGEAVHVSNENARNLAWSFDSRYLIYTTWPNPGIHVFDTQEGREILAYEIPDKRIIGLEWAENGIWMQTENLLEENSLSWRLTDALYWGHFDGTNFELQLVIEASFGLPDNYLRESDLLLTAVLDSPEDQASYEGEFISFQDRPFTLVNPAGEIVWSIDGLADGYFIQTPDNRYISYRKTNGWIYLLELETLESCRVIETDVYGYTWLMIPQS